MLFCCVCLSRLVRRPSPSVKLHWLSMDESDMDRFLTLTFCLQAWIILCLTSKFCALHFGHHRPPPKLAGMFFICIACLSFSSNINCTILFVVVVLSFDVPKDQLFEKFISSHGTCIVHFVPLGLFRLKAENMIGVHM